MNEKTKASVEAALMLFRGWVRPILIGLLGFGAFYFITNGISGEWVDWWIRLFFAGAAEWIVERPVIKVASNIRLKGNQETKGN